MDLRVDVAAVPRDELPSLLGEVTRIEAEIRLRLAEAPAAPAPESRLLDPAEAAAIANVSRRVILVKTRGLAFRRGLSQKAQRFDERGLRAWLASQRQ